MSIREEHEDTLLHETLLCLKALCTTEVALQRLREIQSSLFPSLLAMLFDEEKKGPSEFTTRGVIMNLICMLRLLLTASYANRYQSRILPQALKQRWRPERKPFWAISVTQVPPRKLSPWVS